MFVGRCFIQLILMSVAGCGVIVPNHIRGEQQQLSDLTSRDSSSTTINTLNNDEFSFLEGDSILLAMFPSGKNSYSFNDDRTQEWPIPRDVDTTFIIYGEKLNGSILSFTSHRRSCLLERKDRLYTLLVSAPQSSSRIPERASVTINLPYYGSMLYMCLQSPNDSYPFHQGDRPALKLIVTRRTLPVWATILLLLVLLTLSGLFSGLNLGLMSLTPQDLLVIQEAGTGSDREYAKRIYPVRRRGNFLLCTILLGNVLVNSTTTILLDTLIHGILAVAGATLAIVIFGEIVPQAVCSRHGLKIGSKTIFLTRIFMVITFPIAFPLSKVLDWILGEEVASTYTRDQMNALLKHTRTTDIEDREKKIITGVLGLKTKKIREIMTNLIDVFMLEADQVIDDQLVLTIHGYGHSRIPVYEKQREHVIGLINIRDFALLDIRSEKFTVRSLMSFYKHRYGNLVMPDDSCYDVFNQLKKEQYHMGIVVEYDRNCETDPKAKAIGVVTLEDIIEEMIQEEIVDETDVFTDNRGKVRNILSQAPDFSAFIRQTETSQETARTSAQMKVAIVQFLSTSVDKFTSQFISSEILTRLVNGQFYQEFEYNEQRAKNGNATYIYEYGKQADYFVLILNGQAELITGKEKIVSEVGPFSFFGVSALCDSDGKIEEIVRSNEVKSRPFIPDFSLKVCENVKLFCIRRKHWLAAVRATFFENKQKPTETPVLLDFDGNQTDLFAEQLQKGPKTSSIRHRTKHDRPRSLTFTADQEQIPVGEEDLYPRVRSQSTAVDKEH